MLAKAKFADKVIDIFVEEPVPMTLDEVAGCSLVTLKILRYREEGDFLKSECWMDEWALGYLRALLDQGEINTKQWAFLVDAFQPDDLEEPNAKRS